MGENKDFFNPKDFRIGETVQILNKTFFIYDMDSFTKEYYRDMMGEQNLEGLPVDPLPQPNLTKQVPPHEGARIGSLEDSLQNCLRLAPKQPKTDLRKRLENAGKTLRFEIKLESSLPTDNHRRFILSYHLEDDTISIFENAAPNSGMRSGRFLERGLLYIPGSSSIDQRGPEAYRLDHLSIGNIIHVYSRRFRVTGADRAVLKYIDNEDIYLPSGFRETLEASLMMNKGKIESEMEHIKIPVA